MALLHSPNRSFAIRTAQGEVYWYHDGISGVGYMYF